MFSGLWTVSPIVSEFMDFEKSDTGVGGVEGGGGMVKVIISFFLSRGGGSAVASSGGGGGGFSHVGCAVYHGDGCVIECFEKRVAAASWEQWEVVAAELLKKESWVGRGGERDEGWEEEGGRRSGSLLFGEMESGRKGVKGEEEGNGGLLSTGRGFLSKGGDCMTTPAVGVLVPGICLSIPPGLLWVVRLLEFWGKRVGLMGDSVIEGEIGAQSGEDSDDLGRGKASRGGEEQVRWKGSLLSGSRRGVENSRYRASSSATLPPEILVLLPNEGGKVLYSFLQSCCVEAAASSSTCFPFLASCCASEWSSFSPVGIGYGRNPTDRSGEKWRRKLFRIQRLERTSAFAARLAIPRLQKMYPHVGVEVWHCRLHTGYHAMMSSLAALLYYVIRAQANVWQIVESAGDPCSVFIPEDTSYFLQCTRSEMHPCQHQGVGKAKEGLSLFSVLSQFIQSARGKATLHHWFAFPSRDEAELLDRQEVVLWFHQPSHQELVHSLRFALHHMYPTQHILHLIRAGKANASHYYRLLSTFKQYTVIFDLLSSSSATRLSFIKTCLQSFTISPLRDVVELLQQTFFPVKRKDEKKWSRRSGEIQHYGIHGRGENRNQQGGKWKWSCNRKGRRQMKRMEGGWDGGAGSSNSSSAGCRRWDEDRNDLPFLNETFAEEEQEEEEDYIAQEGHVRGSMRVNKKVKTYGQGKEEEEEVEMSVEDNFPPPPLCSSSFSSSSASGGCAAHPPVIQRGADPTGLLEELRTRLAEVPLTLHQKVQQVFSRLPGGLQEVIRAHYFYRYSQRWSRKEEEGEEEEADDEVGGGGPWWTTPPTAAGSASSFLTYPSLFSHSPHHLGTKRRKRWGGGGGRGGGGRPVAAFQTYGKGSRRRRRKRKRRKREEDKEQSFIQYICEAVIDYGPLHTMAASARNGRTSTTTSTPLPISSSSTAAAAALQSSSSFPWRFYFKIYGTPLRSWVEAHHRDFLFSPTEGKRSLEGEEEERREEDANNTFHSSNSPLLTSPCSTRNSENFPHGMMGGEEWTKEEEEGRGLHGMGKDLAAVPAAATSFSPLPLPLSSCSLWEYLETSCGLRYDHHSSQQEEGEDEEDGEDESCRDTNMEANVYKGEQKNSRRKGKNNSSRSYTSQRVPSHHQYHHYDTASTRSGSRGASTSVSSYSAMEKEEGGKESSQGLWFTGVYYFTSPELIELQEWMLAIQLGIERREVALRREVDRLLVLHSLYLLPPSEHLAALDCLLSFSVVAQRYGWVRPIILSPSGKDYRHHHHNENNSDHNEKENNPPRSPHGLSHPHSTCSVLGEEGSNGGGTGGGGWGGVLHIKGGWHPVLGGALSGGGGSMHGPSPPFTLPPPGSYCRPPPPPSTTTTLLPFDFHITSPDERVCVVLGLNSSGKSVMLSAVALLVFLAHLGAFVPAAFMSLSLFRGIICASPVPTPYASSFYSECISLSRALSYCEAERQELRYAVAQALSIQQSRAKEQQQQQQQPEEHQKRKTRDTEKDQKEGNMRDLEVKNNKGGNDGSLFFAHEKGDGEVHAEDTSIEEVVVEDRLHIEDNNADGPAMEKDSDGDPFLILRSWRPSLFLLDELGKGTVPEDGRALLGSVLRYFTQTTTRSSSSASAAAGAAAVIPLPHSLEGLVRDISRPIVLCATHYREVLDFTRDLNLHRFAPAAVFPFPLVQIYEMQSSAVFTRRRRKEEDRGGGGEREKERWGWERCPQPQPLPPPSSSSMLHPPPYSTSASSALLASQGGKDHPRTGSWERSRYHQNTKEEEGEKQHYQHKNNDKNSEEDEEEVLLDVLPTYHPYPITAAANAALMTLTSHPPHPPPPPPTSTATNTARPMGLFPIPPVSTAANISREDMYYYYTDHSGRWCGGPSLGRRCGLHPRLVEYWENTLEELMKPPCG